MGRLGGCGAGARVATLLVELPDPPAWDPVLTRLPPPSLSLTIPPPPPLPGPRCRETFHKAISFNQDISGWDTAAVTNFAYVPPPTPPTHHHPRATPTPTCDKPPTPAAFPPPPNTRPRCEQWRTLLGLVAASDTPLWTRCAYYNLIVYYRMACLNLGSGGSNFFASGLRILWSQNMLIQSTRENDIIVVVESKALCTFCPYQRPYGQNVHTVPEADSVGLSRFGRPRPIVIVAANYLPPLPGTLC